MSTVSPVNIVLLQDKWEAKHAKNTGRLIKACLSNTQVINVDAQQAEMLALESQLLTTIMSKPHSCYLLFPSKHSQDISTLSNEDKRDIDTLIFLDTTWRKATRLLALYPWLLQLNMLNIDAQSASRYVIRKSRQTGGMSTLEAVDLSLKQLFNFEQQDLLSSFDAMQDKWMAFLPSKAAKH